MLHVEYDKWISRSPRDSERKSPDNARSVNNLVGDIFLRHQDLPTLASKSAWASMHIFTLHMGCKRVYVY